MKAFFSEADLSISEFARVCEVEATIGDYSLAVAIEENVVIYSGDALRDRLSEAASSGEVLKSEFAQCLSNVPGVFVIQGADESADVIDRSTELFFQIIADEKASGAGKGDHFGSNERIWNSLQKACLRDPELFIEYYKNPLLALASEAWLGPGYRVTAQVNTVKPGSAAQAPHRDYHLGFQSGAVTARFPAHAQILSQFLTLQGAVAHVDMPLESGPTLFLPFSQRFGPGYMAYRRPEFVEYFERHRVQLPLRKGDMVFFNPALFHGAGENRGAEDRMANLLQVSSAMGRTMESLNTQAISLAVYPYLKARLGVGSLSREAARDLVAVVADGYAFPTNLDTDPSIDGRPPETEQAVVLRALEADWPVETLREALHEQAARRLA